MLPTRVLYYGKDEPLPARTLLRAGPLSLVWEEGDLRYVKLGEIEVLRRIYVAIRDRNWGTAPNVMSNLVMDTAADAFRITFDVENCLNEIHLTWHGDIEGTAEGTISFTMDGEAQSTFMKNRIGFCVLHPDDIAGAKAEVEHVDGSKEATQLPRQFVPDQPVQPFAEMRRLSHEVRPGVWADLSFEGDIFEMEDQRNWTDASYKTFSTPLRLPFPVEVPAGTRIRQALRLSVREQAASPAVTRKSELATEKEKLTFTVDMQSEASRLPDIGLGVASHGEPLTAAELSRLAVLAPSHLRVDLVLSDPQFPQRLGQASDEAAQLGAVLEPALFVDPARAAEEMLALGKAIDFGPRVARWLVFPVREQFRGGSPIREVLEAVRPVIRGFRPDPVVAGTNADYVFLARNIPPLELVDGLAFAITAEVHAFDNASVVETLSTQGQAAASARALSKGKPVFVSPVTYKMRHNPYATSATPPTPPDQLPSEVDQRQMSLFTAGWTAASIKHLAQAGAAAITYFETTGWRGVMEVAGGSRLPSKFQSIAGAVFPVFHTLADVAAFRDGAVVPSRSSDRLAVDGLALRRGHQLRVLLANLTASSQSVALRLGAIGAEPGTARRARIRVLDAANAEWAMVEPEAFRSAPPESISMQGADLTLNLSPYAVATVDVG